MEILSNLTLEIFNQPFLLEILPIIYGLKFIKNNVQFVASVEKRIPDVNAVRIVREKTEELETLFLNVYAKCSNKKEFNFEQFKSLFDKVKKMTYREFEKTVNSLTDSSRRSFLRKSLRLLLFVQLLF